MGGHIEERSRLVYVLLGVCLVTLFAIATAVSVGVYRGSFASTVPVTLYSARSGLMLEPGSDIKMRDVVVGRVSKVQLVDDQAQITMDIDESRTSAIPENITAVIDPTTLFGRKFVTLVQPEHPSATTVSAGSVVRGTGVATEVNDLLDSLVTVLRTVEPQKVNATLSALSTSLQGRGDQLGDMMVELDTYLSEFNGSLPTLQRDLVKGAEVSDVLADAAPDLLRTVDHVSTTGDTVTEKEDQFSAFLLSFSSFGNSGRSFFEASGDPLEKSLDALEPTTALLAQNAPIYPCFLASMDQTNKYLERTVGGSDQAGLNILGTLLMGDPPYTYPENAPKNGADGAPRCYDLAQAPGHTDFDDGSKAYQPARGVEDLIGNPFAQFMFGGGR
ncbi:phospholipid/cholesterol/gamma-HCH transport system substrate-binding protein [Rhodococcus wratislaviensis]|uniref:Mce family protein n=1 Tax=Rhodococcus wratislaviensis TaxID=44752 RepID=A0AB38FE93_RHOWR|nr:MCE family protein [Rhodococcus wratislaviensis]REE75062.1 phospholipid/cholesterol/gamma-HCH transport system substrate-binding protein [Rhodococcus wratislaviensis]SPZ39913.1 Mce family protein [Rhodococcus wratislaviensis]